jgi:hypothetical protein
MAITVKVPDEIAAEAERLGIPPEQYVQEILRARAGVPAIFRGRVPKLRPEEVRQWLDELAQFSDKIPELPERITREWIYQGHD